MPLPPGIPAVLALGALHSLPTLALLQSHSLAKRSWHKPQDQLETAFIPGGRRRMKAHTTSTLPKKPVHDFGERLKILPWL